jgi:hypothetical protein
MPQYNGILHLNLHSILLIYETFESGQIFLGTSLIRIYIDLTEFACFWFVDESRIDQG